MKIENNGQGFLRKNLTGELEYSSFVPTPLSRVAALELSSDTVKLLSACSRKIGELEGMLRFVPNASMYLAMYVRKEPCCRRKLKERSARLTIFSTRPMSDLLAKMCLTWSPTLRRRSMR